MMKIQEIEEKTPEGYWIVRCMEKTSVYSILLVLGQIRSRTLNFDILHRSCMTPPPFLSLLSHKISGRIIFGNCCLRFINFYYPRFHLFYGSTTLSIWSNNNRKVSCVRGQNWISMWVPFNFRGNSTNTS